ncbi:5888_t:CDS:2 [Paraglomus brasilianum]|uniref:5888_t:CDS:1 n=1 Tax=Paraglomus brasilianum TaxID=144538 RepID=A0A9N8W811_9GLOM|nr:5888_t:CDS:2 [Paraglomus brasilianum]
MSKKVREFRGASIELISPVAQVVYFPGVAELFTIIERIVVLIDTARYNREALLYMKVYMTEVKQTIRDNSETINEEYTPSLMKALKKLGKIDRKIRDLFTDLDNALNAADLRVTLENNKDLKKILGITKRVDEHMMDLDNRIKIDITTVKDVVTEKVKNSFMTTAIFHGVPLSQEIIDELTINPEHINPVCDAQPNGDVFTKVIYCGGLYAAKVKIARAHNDISLSWAQAFMSSKSNEGLFTKIFGILLDGGTYYMITEWPGKGTLYEYLKTHRDIPWSLKIRWAIQLARALDTCHSKFIIHHVIHSRNVIVDMNDNVKLTKYLRDRRTDDCIEIDSFVFADEYDVIRWSCPEKHDPNPTFPITMSADVYSFGMLMWAITSHEIPFPDKSIVEVYTLLKNSVRFKDQDAPRPPVVPGTPENYTSIMQKCWRQDPGNRPTMAYVVAELERLEMYRKNSPDADTYGTCSSSMQESEPREPEPITIYSARKLHAEKRYREAFKQFKTLADDVNPDAEANFYVGRYLMDDRIGCGNDLNVGISYLEVAEDLGCSEAIQYRAQEKMAAAAELRKRFIEAGKLDDANLILERMKTECLPLFRNGADRGNLRCMKDLADYGAKLGDKQSYVDGLRMLDNLIAKTQDPKQKAKAQDYLVKLQQHKNAFMY